MNQFGLKEEQIIAIKKCLSQYPEIDKVILYGSRAKGNYRKGSDIDLVIIDQEQEFDQLLRLDSQLDDLLLPYKIDLSLKRQITNSDLLEHIERVGVLFYSKTEDKYLS